MQVVRSIMALGVLVAYLSGVVVHTAHALLAHSDGHPTCSAENEQHLHGEEYHFDSCDLCVFSFGNQSLEEDASLSQLVLNICTACTLIEPEQFLPTTSTFSFYRRGPPC